MLRARLPIEPLWRRIHRAVNQDLETTYVRRHRDRLRRAERRIDRSDGLPARTTRSQCLAAHGMLAAHRKFQVGSYQLRAGYPSRWRFDSLTVFGLLGGANSGGHDGDAALLRIGPAQQAEDLGFKGDFVGMLGG